MGRGKWITAMWHETGLSQNDRNKGKGREFPFAAIRNKLGKEKVHLKSVIPEGGFIPNKSTPLPKLEKISHRTWLGRVLVMEGRSADFGSLGVFLKGEGLEVVCCTSAKEALCYLRELSLALVIVGRDVPDAEHSQLLYLLKTSQPQLPVLFAKSHNGFQFDDYFDPMDRVHFVENTGHHKEFLPHIYRILLARYDRYAQDLEMALEESTSGKRELQQKYDRLLSHILGKTEECDRINQALQKEAKIRRRVEASLIDQEDQLLHAQASREAFCQDLHDGVLQLLYAVLLDLGRGSPLLQTDPLAARQRIDHAIELLRSIMSEIRSYIGGREQQDQVKNDFHCMVEAIVNQRWVGEGPPLECELSVDPEASQQLTQDQASHLTFIVKEALSNCLRHGKATAFGTTLRVNGKSISLQVRDNGVGFSLDNMKSGGHGLRNMAKRAKEIGGNINIDSKPSQGTRILVNLPRAV